MKRIASKKNIYLLTLLVISLFGFVLSSTYAKFGSSYTTTSDVVGFDFSFQLAISNIEEYQEIIVDVGTTETFNIEIANDTGADAYYGVWYRMVDLSELPTGVTIGKLGDSSVATSDSISVNSTVMVSINITNSSNSVVKFNIGVASSTTGTGDIEYLDGKVLVPNSIPGATIITTSDLKSVSQTATISCADSDGVTSYYWGTSAPNSSSDYTSITSTTSYSMDTTINEEGTYYLVCKNADGLLSNIASKTYYNYTVNNMLLKTTGIENTYNTSNYDQSSTYTYIAPGGTSLILASIYTIPTEASSTTFKGVSIGEASATSATVSSTILTLDDTTTYSMWFNRMTYTISYNANGGTNAPDNQTKRYGADLTLTTDEPTRSGFNFLGWSISSSSSTVAYDPGDTYSEDASITLYAVWENSVLYLNDVTVGSYVAYTGNNGCSGNACSGQNANYVSSSNMGYCGDSSTRFNATGWRVAYIANDTAYLISAGAPECFTGSGSFEDYYGDMRAQALDYCNASYVYGDVCNDNSAWPINELSLRVGFGLYPNDCYGSDDTSCLFTDDDLLFIGSPYWLDISPDYSEGFFYMNKNGRIELDDITYYNFGLRPIIRMKSTIVVTGGTGSASSPYVISTS